MKKEKFEKNPSAEPGVNEEKEKYEVPRVELKPLSRKLRENFIEGNGLVRANIEKKAGDSGLSADQYLEEKFFTAVYGGKEYLVIRSESEGGEKDEKIVAVYQAEGPVIYVDNDISPDILDIVILHEIIEYETWVELGKSAEQKKISVEEYDLISGERHNLSHASALRAEDEYAKKTRTAEDYEEYKKSASVLRKNHAGH